MLVADLFLQVLFQASLVSKLSGTIGALKWATIARAIAMSGLRMIIEEALLSEVFSTLHTNKWSFTCLTRLIDSHEFINVSSGFQSQ